MFFRKETVHRYRCTFRVAARNADQSWAQTKSACFSLATVSLPYLKINASKDTPLCTPTRNTRYRRRPTRACVLFCRRLLCPQHQLQASFLRKQLPHPARTLVGNVGKTSLVTSLLRDGKSTFAGVSRGVVFFPCSIFQLIVSDPELSVFVLFSSFFFSLFPFFFSCIHSSSGLTCLCTPERPCIHIHAPLQDQLPPFHDCVTIPSTAMMTPGIPTTHIIDTSLRTQAPKEIMSEIAKASVICVVYAVNESKSFARLGEYWLPMIRKSLGAKDGSHGIPVLLYDDVYHLLCAFNPLPPRARSVSYAHVAFATHNHRRFLRKMQRVA